MIQLGLPIADAPPEDEAAFATFKGMFNIYETYISLLSCVLMGLIKILQSGKWK